MKEGKEEGRVGEAGRGWEGKRWREEKENRMKVREVGRIGGEGWGEEGGMERVERGGEECWGEE